MDELLDCPFCGTDTAPLSSDESMTTCRDEDCPIFGVMFTLEEWNTRHDHNGDEIVVLDDSIFDALDEKLNERNDIAAHKAKRLMSRKRIWEGK